MIDEEGTIVSSIQEIYTENTMTQDRETHRRLGMKRHAEASVHIDAPPEAVWAVIADVTRGGEWSGESRGCEWLNRASSAEEGTRFKGRNRRGPFRWSRVSEVVRVDQPRELVWRTLPSPQYRDSTEWWISLAEEGGGTKVTEGFRVVQMSRVWEMLISSLLPVHRDRGPDLAEDLRRLKKVVEGSSRV
jgi:uncharacterized protein YndB with AHSA1/START domain